MNFESFTFRDMKIKIREIWRIFILGILVSRCSLDNSSLKAEDTLPSELITVTGQIILPEGIPASNTNIWLYRAINDSPPTGMIKSTSANDQNVYSVVTTDGAFVFENIPKDNYDLIAIYNSIDGSITLGTEGRIDLDLSYEEMNKIRAGQYDYDLYLIGFTREIMNFLFGP